MLNNTTMNSQKIIQN